MLERHIPLITYPVILLAVFARQLCLPVPAVLFLLMAGALGASGRMSLPVIIAIGVAGSLAADYIWFQAGRRWGSRILRLLCSFASDRHHCIQRAREAFVRWGIRILVVAKFIPGLDGLMPPLCGMEQAGSLEFLFFDGVGALLWSSAYCITGYVFADHVEAIATRLERFSDVLALTLAAPVLCYVLWRTWEMFRMLRQLRVQTIAPAALDEKLKAGAKIAVLDLLLCEGESLMDAGPGIRGAIRIDPARLRRSSRVHVPEDVEMILYCSSPKAFTSARVAISLRHRGIKRVKVLEGGLNEWRRLNLPVSSELADPEEARARLGITIDPDKPHRFPRISHAVEDQSRA